LAARESRDIGIRRALRSKAKAYPRSAATCYKQLPRIAGRNDASLEVLAKTISGVLLLIWNRTVDE
jgi:hypothetical protein